jgi:hypothetical protein
MPRSTAIFKKETINFIREKFNPESSILDMGAGCGTYSDLFNKYYGKIDGLEVFEPYVDMFSLKDKYRNLYIDNALTFNFDYYNLIIVGDMLEHITEEEGINLIEKLYGKCDDLIIAIPFNSPQDIFYDNEFEIHRQVTLTNESFLEKYKGFKVFCLRYDYGIYIKDIPSNKNSNIYVDPVNIDFDKVKSELQIKYPDSKIITYPEPEVTENATSIDPSSYDKNLTVVTGLWSIGRHDGNFDHYIKHFRKLLDMPNNLFIYIPKEYEYLVWEKRTKENTYVRTWELQDVKELYDPFWNKTQEIRTDPKWYNSTGEHGWLKNSPQATLEWYNPIVQSKLSMLNNAAIWNPFDNEYFIWLDAGITNTVYEKYFTEHKILDKIIPYLDPFLFLSYPYKATDEVHGFDFKAMNRFAGQTVEYVCRGGLFGGKKETIHQVNATYYSTLMQTLNAGYMGTEESIFSIMSYKEPHIYRRFMLDDNGLILKFAQALVDNKVELVPIPKAAKQLFVSNHELSKIKTNLYILTFNFPQQLQHTIDTMEKVPEWLSKPHLVLIDNSTNEEAVIGNKLIAEKYNFEYIKMDTNTGICGGRQKAAEHFHESDADFMFFFEDDMCINSSELAGQFCRNGFRKYIPGLYEIVHKIALKENFDFLKLSFTEVYFDNDKALPWYNVPQAIRTRDWPDYDQLPITGLDPNSPLATYKHVGTYMGVAYLMGEVNYCNWPMIVSKEGNKKMFIDTKWAHPYEQTWSSHIYQITKEGKIHSGLLLASPIWHDRIVWYKPEERREN